MKKLFKLLVIITLFFPFIVFAAVKVDYNDAKYGANNYITDFKNYKWYIDLNTDNKYVYNGTNFSSLDGFKTGGLINKSEYDISVNKFRTYLKTARSYWTITNSGDKTYCVESGKFSLLERTSKSSGVRPTEYVLTQTEVSGQGSYTNPWVFIKPNFYVEIEYVDTEIVRRQGDEELKLEGVAQYGDEIIYKMKLKNTGSKDSKINVREVGMINAINKQISLLPDTVKIKIGDKALTLAEAKKALNDLLSGKGYDFLLKAGETIEFEFAVKIIGNAGDTVSNQIIYSMDDLEAEPSNKNTIAIEKTVQYNEVAEIGANVVMALDNSASMGGTKMNRLKSATKDFLNIMLGPDSNENNEVCIVIMPDWSHYSSDKAPSKCSKDYSTLYNFAMNELDADGWQTPFTSTFEKSLERLKEIKNRNKLNTNYVLFLSDGDPVGDYSNKYTPVANNIKNEAVFLTIGFQTGTSATKILKELSTIGTDSNYPGDMCLYCPNNKNCSNNTNLYEKVCYKDATTNNISEIFKNIAKKMNEKTKITTKGVLAISRNLDKSRNIVIEVTPNNGKGTPYEIKKGYTDALNENYIINKGNRYEINIKKFKSDDKISVTYFLEKN